VWRQVCAMLDEMGVLTVADGAQLERYCAFFVQWRAAVDFVRANGSTYPIRSSQQNPPELVGRLPDGTAILGFKEYPRAGQGRHRDRDVKESEGQFGLPPVARCRVQVQPPEPAADSVSSFARKRGGGPYQFPPEAT